MDMNFPLKPQMTIGQFFQYLADPRAIGSEKSIVIAGTQYNIKTVLSDIAADGAVFDCNGMTFDDSLELLKFIGQNSNLDLPDF